MDHPFVSIIIPTYNRSAQLERTLLHIAKLRDNPGSFEVLVVDNGSTDETNKVLEEFGTKHTSLNFRHFYAPIPGLLTGRHRGAAEAKGDILTFIDDDVHVTSGWLTAIRQTMHTCEDVMLLTGPCLPLYETHPPEWVQHFWTTDANGRYCGWHSLLNLGEEKKYIPAEFVWGLNFTIRKSAFISLKGFNPDNIPSGLQMFQGDGETGLAIKASKAGMAAYYNPDVALYHEIPAERLTTDYFNKRAFYQGVCNSFTKIRNQHNLNGLSVTGEKITPQIKLLKRVKNLLRKSIKFQDNRSINSLDKEAAELVSIFKAEEQRGFDFHQSHFQSNSDVRNWVLKDDYLDYSLPIA